MHSPLVLFDGVCNLCNSAVQFIIRHDKKKVFKFAALQSAMGQKMVGEHSIPVNALNSFILIDKGETYTRSTAALKVVKKLNGLLPILYVFIIIPKFVRNGAYNWVAKNRYKWFGKKETCMVPTAELKARFLN